MVSVGGWTGASISSMGMSQPRLPLIPLSAVRDFLSHLATIARVAASTQNQALAPLPSCTTQYSGGHCCRSRGSLPRDTRAKCPWCCRSARCVSSSAGCGVPSDWARPSTVAHLWQPYNYVTIFAMVLPLTLITWWRKNIYVQIVAHCLANTIGATMSLVAYLQASP